MQEKKNNIKTYNDWFKDIIWTAKNIILPNNRRIDKTTLFSNGTMDPDKLNKLLMDEYNKFELKSND